MSSGVGYRCAIVEGGQVDCWGANTLGQLGNGTLGVDSADPTRRRSRVSAAPARSRPAPTTPAPSSPPATSIAGATTGTGSSAQAAAAPTSRSRSRSRNSPAPPPSLSAKTTAARSSPKAGSGAGARAPTDSSATAKIPRSASPRSAPAAHPRQRDRRGRNRHLRDLRRLALLRGYQYGSTPTPVEGISGARAVAIDTATICVALQAGAVDCWGNYTGSTTPKAVAGVSGALTVDTEARALLLGDQLRPGPLLGRAQHERARHPARHLQPRRPPPDSPLSGALQASGGRDFTCALLASGQIKCLGYNYRGERGNGQIGLSPTPVAVLGIP